ncbi:EAL domain-containing protein [Proteiniclasticum sp. SCR006]|uniref:EAL domain-containing protein n=1 Tax=Proteiniclasticum aestuarii TaxID=2817862 RepID=A0A939H6P9_9CLOT|nr:EAL domain-containing protein [Proteiniclasticum aestuarii]
MFSLLFYGSLILYFYTGMYLLSLDTRDRIHRAFFHLCLSLSTWSLTSSLLAHVETRELAYGALLFSVWGWGFTYSFLLHLVLLLTKIDRSLKRWQWMAVYAPVPVTMTLFYANILYSGVSGRMLLSHMGWSYERMELLAFTWIRVVYLVVMMLILYLLYTSRPEETDASDVRQWRLMKGMMVFSFLLGLPKILGFYEAMGWNLLGLGPMHLLPFSITVFLVMRQKHLKRQDGIVLLPRRGELMSVRTHERIFFYISQGYIFGAFTAFGIEVLLKREEIIWAGTLSLTLFLTGIMIFLILKSRMSIRNRDNILYLIIALSIPYITFYQIEKSEAFAWTVPVIFILIAVIFNHTRLLIYISLMTILTSMGLWMVRPESTITFSYADHLGRLIVFGIIMTIAFLINRVYKTRQYQFEKQIDHERFLSEMARLLSSARNRNLKSNLDVFLERSLFYMEADYGSVHIFPERKKRMRKAEYYGLHDLLNPHINHRFAERFDTMVEELVQEKSLYTEKFFNALKDFKEEVQGEGITLMMTPLVESGKILGVMCMCSFERNNWDEGYQNTFKLVAASLSSMLYKIGKEDELYTMAYYDHLTGLPNRLLYEKIIRKQIHETRKDEMLALIFLDLDDFKNINDILGHSTGDRFLKEFAKKLKSKLKGKDLLSRFGGDEFLLILPHAASLEEIEAFAQEVLQEIIKPFLLDEREVRTGASMGISIYPQHGRTGEELIKFADLAMYHAKSHGKNRYTICSEEIKGKFVYEKELEEDLRHAVERNQLVLHYQPKVHGKTEEIIGVEALIRWNHPTKGLLPPGAFLPIAERTGLMETIDTWVFIEACSQNKAWQEKGYRKISMSINITPVSLMQGDMERNLAAVFRLNGWDPKYIEAEITENNMVFSVDHIQNKLKALQDIGIRISLDDFGTAYSSLSRLHELPIDKVKIDRQFILNLDHEGRGKNLYDGILDLARSLDLMVIIEGVETREQADFVRERGCDEIQGYYYHRPMPFEEVEKLLQRMDGGSLAKVMSPEN